MLPDSMIKTFQQYCAVTPVHQQSTASWSKYFNARTAGALDAKPKLKPAPQRRPSRMPDFYETYGVRPGEKIGGGMALDAEMVRRGGNVVMNGREYPECLEDADPSAQAQVESTDREPVDESGHPAGRAPPWGKHDLPAQRSVTEPNPTLATDPPVSERQRKAMGAAASGHSNLEIPKSVGERFLHEDAALGTITHGQQGAEAGPEEWETTRGRDQQHPDEEQDEELFDRRLRQFLKRLNLPPAVIEEAIAGDRAKRAADRRRMAGDAALSRQSFFKLFPEARGLSAGLPAFTPKVLF